MADFNSSLPVKTETAGDVVVKLADADTPSQQVAVDSGGNLATNLTELSGAAVETNNGTVGNGTLRVTLASDSTGQVALASGSNTVGAVNQAGAPWSQNLTQVNGSPVALGQTGMAASIPVVIASNQTAVPVSITNPAGTIVVNYNTASSVASSASSTHTYTVTTGKTLSFDKWMTSASGRVKVEVQVDLGSGLTTKFVGFNSTANPNIYIDFSNLAISVASTKQVAIIRTNLDNQNQDLYSTIMGVEV